MGQVAQESDKKLQTNLLEVTMKNNVEKTLIGVLSTILVIGASAWTASVAPVADDPAPPETAANFSQGKGNGNGNSSVTPVLDITASELSPEEAAALLFMREEKKSWPVMCTTPYTSFGDNLSSRKLLPVNKNIWTRSSFF